jgi:hypothetical protein
VIKNIGKKHPNFGKGGQNSCQAKECKNIFIKAQLKSSNNLHQTIFKPSK